MCEVHEWEEFFPLGSGKEGSLIPHPSILRIMGVVPLTLNEPLYPNIIDRM